MKQKIKQSHKYSPQSNYNYVSLIIYVIHFTFCKLASVNILKSEMQALSFNSASSSICCTAFHNRHTPGRRIVGCVATLRRQFGDFAVF